MAEAQNAFKARTSLDWHPVASITYTQSSLWQPCPKLIHAMLRQNPTMLLLSAVEVQVPTSNEQQKQIAGNEGREDTKVPPSGVERNAERFVELVSNTVCTIRAVRGLVACQVSSATRSEEVRHVLPASLTGRRCESVVLGLLADHWSVVQFVGNKTSD